jgi:DNA-directed RNA polymerase II subunit RPB2
MQDQNHDNAKNDSSDYVAPKEGAEIIDAFFASRPLFITQHHIDSYDEFLDTRLLTIIRSMNPLVMVREDPGPPSHTYTVSMYIGGDSKIRPDHGVHLSETNYSPNSARTKDLTYGVEVTADVHLIFQKDGQIVGTSEFSKVPMGFLPVMLHSRICMLRDKKPSELRSLGECPYDQGGYFVIDGREKVVVTQEERVGNRLYVRASEKGDDNIILKAFIRCFSRDTKDVFPRTSVFRVHTNNEITMTITHLDGRIPLTCIFRALGVESDKEIMDMITSNEDERSFLRTSLVRGAKIAGYNQYTAIAYLVPRTRFHTLLDLKNVLANDLFPNMGSSAADMLKKAQMLARITLRLVRSALGKEPLSELDDYTNKRLHVSGDFVSDSFRDAFYKTGVAATNALNVEFDVGAWRITNDILTLVTEANLKSIFQTYILKDALRLALKGRGKLAESEDPGTPVQALSRVSYLAYVSHMRRVNNPVDRTVKMVSPHVLRASHWGIVCPVESPDGPNIGLLTHLASCCILSPAVPDEIVISLVSKHLEDATTKKCNTFLNDTWIGTCSDPEPMIASLKSLKRKKETRMIGVSWDVHRNEVHIRTDRGRCCRPLIVLPLNKSVPKTFDEMLDSGIIELVDVEEVASNCLIAMQPADIKRYPLNRYTHMEPHASAMLSLVAGTFPMLNHNSGTKSVLSMAQVKQALGISLTSQRDRLDTDAYELNYAQCPLVTTTMANRLFGGRMAYGENLVIAIACYTGYNQEDGVILNLDSVQRGRLNLTTLHVHRFEEEKNDESSTIFANPPLLASRGYNISGNIPKRLETLDERGLPRLHMFIRPGDAILGMIQETFSTTADAGNDSMLKSYVRSLDGVGQQGLGSFVDGISVEPYDRDLSRCKVRVRQMRIPELGDKLASRYGQKGVIGMLLPAIDMPFCAEDGIVPDIIINPNAFPSRMTVAHLLETILAPEAARVGTRFCADTFGGGGGNLDPVLEKLKLQNMGDTKMHSGRGGELIDTQIFVGINYYGRSRHMVEDKYQWRCTGPVDIATRQPAKGAGGMSGGLRVGEMEQNAIMAHGMSGFLKESFMERSDGYNFKISDESGAPTGRWDHKNVWRTDPECPRDVHELKIPFAFKLLQQEMQAIGIDSKLECDS